MYDSEFLSLCGSLDSYSPGTGVIMADRQLRRALDSGAVQIEKIDGERTVARVISSGKWFLLDGGVRTAMLGAAFGDIAGSVYEWRNIKRKLEPDELFCARSRFTDDTVMTCAVAKGLSGALSKLPRHGLNAPEAEAMLFESVQREMQRFGRRYPRAGYGGRFMRWIASADPRPYGSWGNGSAMRASYAGWAAESPEEAEKLGEISARVTHDHPEGIKGAVAVAGCIYRLRVGASKEDVRAYASRFYDLNFTLDDIRERYTFDVSCAGSVPQAIEAFLEGGSFTGVISNAISIGGDSDTIAAIAGSIAEAFYPIPQTLRGEMLDRLDPFLLDTIADSIDALVRRAL